MQEGISVSISKINNAKSAEERQAAVKEYVDMIPDAKLANYAFKNNGDLTFDKSGNLWGLSGEESFSYGAVYTDLDNDGDLDLVVNNVDQPSWLYRNNASEKGKNKYLKIQLEGSTKNTQGIGARVILETPSGQQVKDNHVIHGYISSTDPVMHFGLGEEDIVSKLTVIWPGGKFQVLTDVSAGQKLMLQESQATGRYVYQSPISQRPLFQPIRNNAGIDYKHQENSYDDYEREVLLPHMMSQWGPGAAVGDWNGDGLEDVYLGGASGQAGALYLQQKGAVFEQSHHAALSQDSRYEDLGAVFLDVDGDDDLDLYVVSGGNESDTLSGNYQDRLYLNDQGKMIDATDRLPKITASGSRVKAADYDDDGDIDLVVCGRQTPGRYPYPTDSYILDNQGGRFVDVTDKIAPQLRQLGMVTDAAWVDVTQDGSLDLVMVGEWMPIKVFAQQDGKFVDISEEAELGKTDGWWVLTSHRRHRPRRRHGSHLWQQWTQL